MNDWKYQGNHAKTFSFSDKNIGWGYNKYSLVSEEVSGVYFRSKFQLKRDVF